MEQVQSERKGQAYQPGKDESGPLTFAERQMATEQGLNPASTEYNINFLTYRITGAFDEDRFRKALNALAARHDILRSYYPMEHGEYRRRVMAPFEVPIEIIETPAEDIAQTVAGLDKPFDISAGPLFRVHILEHGDDDRSIHFTFHHIIMDGTSWDIFSRELFELYNGAELPAQDYQYADYAVWQRDHLDTEPGREFFRTMFTDGVPETEMPTRAIRPDELPYADTDVEANISSERLGSLAKELGVTRYELLMSVLGMTLARYTGTTDVVVGTAMSGRTRPEQKDLMGMFVNTLPVRLKPQSDQPVRDYVRGVAETIAGVKGHQTYPFAELVPEYAPDRNASRHPVFDVMFNYLHDTPVPELQGAQVSVPPLKRQALAMDFMLEALAGTEETRLVLSYSPKLYEAQIPRNFLEQFLTILDRIEENADQSVADASELPDDQRRQILVDFAGPRTQDPGDRTIVSMFRTAAAEQRGRGTVAARAGEDSITYDELDEVTDRLAAKLASMGAGPGKVVGVMVHRGLMMPIGALAALKTGAAYLPMDPAYPAERLEFMTGDAGADIIIADRDLTDRTPGYKGAWFFTDEVQDLPAAQSIPDGPGPEDLFILLYTSGTTGTPKGVMLRERNLVNFVDYYTKAYGLGPGDNIPAYASFGFDANMMDMYPTLTSGATLHIVPEEMRLDLPALQEYFLRWNVPIAFLTTQLGRQFATSGFHSPSFRALSTGGETLTPLSPPDDYNLYNLYGPTECTVFTNRYHVTEFCERVPIGRAIDNTSVYVVDPAGRLAPVGVAGELTIAGRQVSAGYLNRPDLTDEKFVPNPFSDDPQYAKMYRTGDVVRFLPSGDVDFVGRRDFQVKIRGFRVELTEIEGRIREFGGITDATVIAQEDAGGGKRIVAYVVADTPVDIKELNAFIAETLPAYMVPAATMQLDRIPLNPNGKVDRRKLPKVTIQAEETVAPRTPMEAQIAAVVSEVLGGEEVGVTTDLMYAGLNSLSAIKAAALITESVGRRLTAPDILREKTIEKLALLLENGEEYEQKTYAVQSSYPLTQNQLGLYFALLKDPASLVYNIPIELSLGDIDAAKLRDAIAEVIDAHSYMKTHLALEDGEPVQLRLDDDKPNVELVKCTDEEFQKLRSSFVRPFQFFEGPLYRIAVCETPSGVHLLADFHHIIFDGTSLDIFLRDVAAAYEGKDIGKEKFTSFDLAKREKERAESDSAKQARAFYDRVLADGEGATQIPPDHERAEEGSPQYVTARVSKNLIAPAIRGLGITPSNLFLGATGLVTGRYAGTRDIRIASITSGRDGAELQNNIGMLVRTLPTMLEAPAGTTAQQYLLDTQNRMADTLANEDYSYLQAASDYGYNAQIMYAYQGGVVSEHTLDGKPIEYSVLGLDRAKFPVSVNVSEDDDSYIVEAEYDDAVFSERLMQAFADSIAHSAAALAENPDRVIEDISVQSAAQKARTDSFNKVPEPVEGTSLHARFEEWARNTPDRPALYAADGEYTFAQLNERANVLANALIEVGAKKGDRIAFILPRDSRILASMLGIMKAGAAYIPVDPDYPKERIEHILSDSGARFILTDGPSDLPGALDVNKLLEGSNTSSPEVPVRQDDLAYLIYTSGSTGRPKGVMITHGNILNYVADRPENVPVRALLEEDASMVSVTTVSFDMFLKEAFTTLMNGLRLILADDEQAKNPDKLAELFQQAGGSAFNATPSRMLQYMEQDDMRRALAQAKVVMAGGEGFPAALYDKLRAVTDAKIINTYGPTEITVSSNGKVLTDSNISVGAPLSGVVEQITDIEGQPLPAGVTGELWIGGNGVGRGYFGNPEMTEQQFVTRDNMRFYKSGDLARWTDEGDVEILGRNDGQIKLRGLRIELGEIENVIGAQPGITSCVVLVRKVHGQEQLCAYYTADREISPEELRAAISENLTKYMVPAAYLQLDAMPMTPNGKIDRRNLPEPVLMRREEYVEPEGQAERDYAQIFADVLELDRVGATDSFFDLGGTSLLVTQVTIDAAKKGYHLSYADVFANPTPRELAALGEGGVRTAPDTDEITGYDYTAIHDMLRSNTVESLRSGEMRDLGNVCITGATGFLGIHVLREYLRSEKGTAYCIVRGGRIEAAERLRSMLVYYFSDSFDDLFGTRIVVVDGDITDPEVFRKLEKYPIDTLINCAANVKHFSAGTDIEDVNVGGAKNALEFCKKKGCLYVQVSTASVAGMSIDGTPEETTVLDEQMLYFGQDLSNKYTNSKFLAERNALEAAANGEVEAKIMRVGNLMAREEDGEFQANFKTNNFLGRLQAYNLIGKVPYADLGINAEFAPIDATARAILALSKTPRENRVFHPYNDHSVYLSDVMSVLRTLGVDVEPVEAEDYELAYSDAMRDRAKARHLNSLIAYQEYGKRVVPVPSVNSYTSQALLRLGFQWPITTREYLTNFLELMNDLGFFDDVSDTPRD